MTTLREAVETPMARHSRPRTRSRRQRTIAWIVLVGFGVILGVAGVLRLHAVTSNLPALTAVHVDEPVVVNRAVGLVHGQVPTAYDWPSGAMLLLAAPLWVMKRLAPSAVKDPYVLGRYLFALVSLALVLLTALLGTVLRDPRRHGLRVPFIAGSAVALSYLAVENGRLIVPDQLQAGLAVGSMVCTLVFDRTRLPRWLIAAGCLAGLSAGAKYTGGLVLLPALGSVLLGSKAAGRRKTTADAGLLVVSSVVGFIVSVPGTLVHPAAVWKGLSFQAGHESHGHLGYDLASNGWWYYLRQALVGNWGWIITILAVAGVGLALFRGTREDRLPLVFVLPTFLLLGASSVQFPHYILLLLPFLAVYAALAADRLVDGVSAITGTLRFGFVVPVIVLVSLVPTVLNDVRLLRAATAPSTQLIADQELQSLHQPVWVEPFTVTARLPGETGVAVVGYESRLTECGCYVVLSSYYEGLFRSELVHRGRDAAEVALYDKLKAKGRLIQVISSARPEAYNWLELPQYGLGSIPLTGPVGPVGPTISVYEVPGSAPNYGS